MIFTDDIILVGGNVEEAYLKLDEWRLALKRNRVKNSRNKSECIK